MPETFNYEKPSLSRLLQIILEQYRFDGSILKELIQNAEDAKASKVVFVLDNTYYDNENAPRELKDLMGPALVAYNDAVFTEQDWKGISMLYESVKKDKQLLVGRFGLGFKSVYHLTDAPFILSENFLAVQDPSENRFKNKYEWSSGKRWNLSNESDLEEVKQIITSFDCLLSEIDDVNSIQKTKDGNLSLKGTAIKLPLKPLVDEKKSSVRVTVTKLSHLFEFLRNTDYMNILFLRNVKLIQLYKKDGADSSPRLMCSINSTDTIINDSFPPIYNELHKMQCESSIIRTITIQSSNKTEENQFLVTSLLAGKDDKQTSYSEKLTELMTLPSYTPLINLAVPLKKIENFLGHTFVLLPLPLSKESLSGLPLHVSGFFCVTKDRKSVHLPTEDQELHAIQDMDVIWNMCLINELIPECYVKLLEVLVARIKDYRLYLSFFPNYENAIGYWKTVSDTFYRQLRDRHRSAKIFVESDIQGKSLVIATNRLRSINECHFVCMDNFNNDVMSSIQKIAKVMNSKSVVFLNTTIIENLSSSNDNFSDKLLDLTSMIKLALKCVSQSSLNFNICQSIFKKALQSSDKNILKLLMNSAWIPITKEDQQKLHKPMEVVNPNSKLGQLFDKSIGLFPDDIYPIFKDPQLLEKMEEIRTNGKYIYYPKIVTILFQFIHNNYKNQESFANSLYYSLTFLEKYLQKHHQQKQHVESVDAITSEIVNSFANWPLLPVTKNNESTRISTNSATKWYSFKYQILVKTVAYVFRFEKLGLQYNSIISEALHLLEKPDIQTVLQNHYEIMKTQNNNEEKLQNMEAMLKFVNGNKTSIEKLSNLRWPTNDFIFLPTNQLCFDHDCPKIVDNLDSVHSSLALDSFKNILIKLNIRQTFEVIDYQEILKSWYSQDTQLSNNQCQNLLPVFTYIYESVQSTKQRWTYYLISADNYITEASKLSIDDTPWIKKHEIKGDFIYCHSSINAKLAKNCGAKSKVDQFRIQRSLPLSCFGQHENLTDRLKNIVERYNCDDDVIKEFMQNADDAGATEIHFILDHRNHKTQAVYNKKYGNEMHGASLLIANNRTFSEEDLNGIQSLGCGNKATNCDKIGQFGQGFNCCYRLSDVPSLLTTVKDSRVFCQFDPHFWIAEREIGIGTPGFRLEVDQDIQVLYQDMYETFLPQYYNHDWTVFRLPLRTFNQASKSKIIKNVVCYPNDLEKKLHEVRETIKTNLLFLPNIKEVKFYIIRQNSDLRNPLLTSITKTTFTSSLDVEIQFPKVNDVFTKSNKMYSYSESICIEESDKKKSQWIIFHQYGLNDDLFGECINDLVVPTTNDYLNMKPHGAVALELEEQSRKPVNVNKTHCFQYLSLPQQLKLPVYVHGHWMLDDARRAVKVSGDKANKIKQEWNKIVAVGIVGSAYADLIQWAVEHSDLFFKVDEASEQKYFDTNAYFQIFPRLKRSEINNSQKLESLITNGLIKCLITRKLKVIPSVDCKSMVKNFHPIFENKPCKVKSITENIKNHKDNELLIPFLERSSINMCSIPDYMLNLRFSIEPITATFVLGKLLRNMPKTPIKVGITMYESIKLFIKIMLYLKESPDVELFPLCVTATDLLVTIDKQNKIYPPEMSLVCPSVEDKVIDCDLYNNLKDVYVDKITYPLWPELAKLLLGSCSHLQTESPVFVNSLARPYNSELWIKQVWEFVKTGKPDGQNTDKVLKKVFEKIAIIPGKCDNQRCLLPFCMAHILIKSEEELIEVLRLQTPKLPWKVFKVDEAFANEKFIGNLAVNCTKFDSVLIFLNEYFKQNENEFSFNAHDRNEMLNFLVSKGGSKSRDNTNLRNMILELPIHMSLNNQHTSLTKRTKLLPQDLPRCSISLVQDCDNNNEYILPTDKLTYDFYKMLPLTVENTIELYVKLIIPRFPILTQEDIIQHLIFLKEKEISPSDHLKTALTSFPIIKTTPNDKSASIHNLTEFHYSTDDDGDIMFKQFLKQSTTKIPDEYWQNSLRTFLINLGLKNSLADDEVIKYCNELSQDAASHISNESDEIFFGRHDEKCGHVADFVKKRINKTQTNLSTFLEKLKTINFIFSEPDLFGRRHLTNFQSVHVHKNKNLICAIGKSLPKQLDPEDSLIGSTLHVVPKKSQKIIEVCNLLEITHELEPETVVHNIREIIKIINSPVISSDKETSCIGKMQTAVAECLGHLHLTHKVYDTKQYLEVLQNEKCVIQDDGTCHYPKDVVQEDFDNVFFFKLPDNYDKTTIRMLHSLGMKPKPDFDSYINILDSISYAQFKNDKNYQQAVLKCYEKCCRHMYTVDKQKFKDKEKFMFLTTEDRFVRSEKCIHSDVPAIEAQLVKSDENIILKKANIHTGIQVANIINKLPENLKPKRMSSLIKARLNMVELKPNEIDRVSEKVKDDFVMLYTLINSSEFRHCMFFALRHFYNIEFDKLPDEVTALKMMQNVKNIELQLCKCVQKVYDVDKKYEGKLLCKPISKEVYTKKTQNSLLVYISQYSFGKGYRLINDLANCLMSPFDQILRIQNKKDLNDVIGGLLSAEDPEHCWSVLSENEIDVKYQQIAQFESAHNPGEFLNDSQYIFVSNDMYELSSAKTNDLVLYLNKDNYYVVARIINVTKPVSKNHCGVFQLSVDPIREQSVSGIFVYSFVKQNKESLEIISSQDYHMKILHLQQLINIVIQQFGKFRNNNNKKWSLTERILLFAVEIKALFFDTNVDEILRALEPIFPHFKKSKSELDNLGSFMLDSAKELKENWNLAVSQLKLKVEAMLSEQQLVEVDEELLLSFVPQLEETRTNQLSVSHRTQSIPTNANQLLQQSEEDLLAIQSNENIKWICLKVYHSVDKALKALLLFQTHDEASNMISAVSTTLQSLLPDGIANDDDKLSTKVKELDDIFETYGSLCYQKSSSNYQEWNQDQTDDVTSNAQRIVQLVKDKILANENDS